MESYPRPRSPGSWTSNINTRTLLPIYPSPEPLSSPTLPSAPRRPVFDAPYTLTTHVVPAAFLRTTADVPVPQNPPTNISKAERQQVLAKTVDDLRAVQEEALVKTLGDGHQKVLWNCVNRYVKKDGAGKTGVTLFFAHANGFPKEIWEPTLQHLLLSPASQIVDEIWTWESIQHGDAALINARDLAGTFDWTDNARDILNFLLCFLPDSPSSPILPTRLSPLPLLESERRKNNGFSERTLVVVGHSYGGCTSALATLTYPALFSSLIMVDPVIVPIQAKEFYPGTWSLALGALQRRETWATRAEALQTFSKNSFFNVWDPAVLKVYTECGLCSSLDADGNTCVRLKMPGIHEAIVFSETHTPCEVWQRLPDIDERIEIRWVMPGKPGSPELGGLGSTQMLVWRRPSNSSNIRIPSAGHLIAQEAPRELAHEIRDFILRKYSTIKANL